MTHENTAEVTATWEGSRLKECVDPRAHEQPLHDIKEDEDGEEIVIDFSKTKTTQRAQRSAGPPLAAVVAPVAAPPPAPGRHLDLCCSLCL